MKRECFLFDVDGTLTDACKPIEHDFSRYFERWIAFHPTYLVSGSKFSQIQYQVGQDIIDGCKGVFSCMGNEYRRGESFIYQNKLNLKSEVYDFLLSKLENSPWSVRAEPHFEERSGMLNFSIVGRGADFELRSEYKKWDRENRERETIAEEFNSSFSKRYNLEALVGGEISLDIQQIGKDKGQIIDHLDYDNYIFFGDKCHSGGNDYNLYIKCHEKWEVESYHQTFSILKTNYERQNAK
jgi:HAD superfamily hydrolase (TIGR01484 family)